MAVKSSIVLVTLLVLVHSKWQPTNTRHFLDGYQNDAESYGPNICTVQEVFRTGEKFYADCVKSRLKRICDRPTFIRYQCCSGYSMVEGEKGCPALEPIKNLRDTLDDLGLTEVSKLLTNTEIESNLREGGAYTIFAPIDEAFGKLTHDQKQRLFPWTYDALSLVHYHIVPGWLDTASMKKGQEVPTLYYGQKPVRINRDPLGVYTVNCARILQGNILADNGVIHIIDKLIGPYDMFGNVTEVIMRETQKYSQFLQVLYTAEMVEELRDTGMFTVFAPNNYAFSRVPETLRAKMMKDKTIAQAVIKHHVAEGVYCRDAILINRGIRSMDGDKVTIRCRKSGHYAEKCKIIQGDIVAGNGVIHTLDKLMLPPIVQTMDEVARHLRLRKFLMLLFEAGLLDVLETSPDITLFAPSDHAFRALSKSQMEDLKYSPDSMEKLLKYHTIQGRIVTDGIVGNKAFMSDLGVKLKVTVHRSGILVDGAEIEVANKVCSNGVIHVIDRVLWPPEDDLMTLIGKDSQLREFKKALEKTGAAEILSKLDGHFTVLAPTDEAFERYEEIDLNKMYADIDRFEMRMKHHIINRLIITRGITPQSIVQLTSEQNEPIDVSRDEDNNFTVNKYASLVERDKIAVNGVLHKIDRVLHCECLTDIES